jgi:amino acid efflux transporter
MGLGAANTAHLRPMSRTVASAAADRHAERSARELRRSITLPQAVALYAGAVIGAGVLILPGVGARTAGPASLLAWTFDSLLGVPIALTFAALAARFPDAGGVATFASRAFGAAAGAVVGWSYFAAASVAQALVVLTGGHYAADALHLGRPATFAFGAAMLALAVVANLHGLRVSARLQLILSAAVALVLIAATVAAIPQMRGAALTPFMPDGWSSVGRAAILLFFAFFGWEAITHLSSEFRDPARDVPRATVLAVGLVSAIYLGVAFAVVATGTYGTKQLDRVAVAHVLGASLGVSAKWVAATAAVVITVGTANAFVAATSRLGYALGGDEALPTPLAHLSRRDVPDVAIAVVGAIAAGGLGLALFAGWGAEAFLVVPNSLVIVVYAVAMAAGVRLLAGLARLVAVAAALLCLAILPFAGVSLAIPAGVAGGALLYTGCRRGRRGPSGDVSSRRRARSSRDGGSSERHARLR